MIDFSVIFAGFGGQGILSAGKMAAEAALYEGKEVSWFPSYGPEMRGGTANCSVVFSDEPIGSPVVNDADVVICLNQPSMEKFEKQLKQITTSASLTTGDPIGSSEITTEQLAVPPRISGPYEGNHETSLPS